MATPRDIRRLALQAMYQLDVRGEADAEAVRNALDDPDRVGPKDLDKAMALAVAAHAARRDADDAVRRNAPDWPAHRQPAIDRAILRMGHYEISSALAPSAVIINEAVELAKEFSTERSPAFVNALLDKIAKSMAAPTAPKPTAEPAIGPDDREGR